MRCLYCGKELALLKRWTGGGEFCSDAHRQQYQEEYNQLALSRLLQAEPTSEPAAQQSKPPLAQQPAESKRPEPTPVSPAPAAAPIAVATTIAAAPIEKPKPVITLPSPQLPAAKAEPAPEPEIENAP